MIHQLLDALRAHPEIAQWTVRHQQTREWQHYLIQNQPEATRDVHQELYIVTLCHSHPGPDGRAMMGKATVTLTAADREQIAAQLDAGLRIAAMTSNLPWTQPSATAWPDVPLHDEETLLDPLAAIERMAEQLQVAVAQEPQIRLSAAEFFFEERFTRLYSSAGIEVEERGTQFVLELVLLAAAATGDAAAAVDETEHFVIEKRRRLADLDVADLVADIARNARDSLVAQLPQTWNGPVVLDHNTLYELFEPAINRADAQAKFMGISPAKIGAPFLGEREVVGEPLHLALASDLPYGVRSHRFDEEGVPGQTVEVVTAGTFRRFHGGQRFADYLGVPATGEGGNLVIGPGTQAADVLLQGPLFYIVAFSAMMPNGFTGDFAAEIKLGYYIDEHGVRTPVKGGSLTGNLFDALTAAQFAREVRFMGRSEVPTVIRFNRHVTIAGENQ